MVGDLLLKLSTLKPYNRLCRGSVFLRYIILPCDPRLCLTPLLSPSTNPVLGFRPGALQWRLEWLMIMIDSLHPIAPFLRYEYDDNTKNKSTHVMFALNIHPARAFSILSYFAIFFLLFNCFFAH